MSTLTDEQRDAIEDAILAMENSGWTRSRDASLSVLRAIIAAHEAAKPGWVSIAERLPKKYEEVMVWPQPTGYCMTGELGDSGWTYGEYETGWGHVDSMMSDPTHWMPLPPPPDA